MDLGAFSVSLAVADLAASRGFYERMGFVASGGDAGDGWQIMRNGSTTIGLFQDMFDRNVLTFNPGVDGTTLAFRRPFQDVRDIEARLLGAGVELAERTRPGTQGAAHISTEDPDGNPILIDQFDMPDDVDGLAPPELPVPPMPLDPGAFSYRLAVDDVERSRDFYQRLGFSIDAGPAAGERSLTMRNGEAVVGLDDVDLERNTLTFNPGLDAGTRAPLRRPFSTVEEISSVLIGRGLRADRSHVPAGARAIGFVDPDRNPVLIHQLH